MGDERNAWSKPRPDIICLEGNGSRQSHRGGGWSTEGVMYTLNGTEVHAVCVGVDLYNQTITGGGVKDIELIER